MLISWQHFGNKKTVSQEKMQIIEIKRIRKHTKIKRISLIKTTTLSGMSNIVINKKPYCFASYIENSKVFLC